MTTMTGTITTMGRGVAIYINVCVMSFICPLSSVSPRFIEGLKPLAQSKPEKMQQILKYLGLSAE